MSTIEKLDKDEAAQHHARAVSVITPTLDWRRELLDEAKQSVLDQTVECQHLICVDGVHHGPALVRNALLQQAQRLGSEYVAFLDDDDLLDADHVEVLLTAMESDRSDLAFSWYRSIGATPETPRYEAWDDHAYGTMLGGRNVIPITVVARLDAICDAGGFNPNDRYEDHALWLRMLDRGSGFSIVPRETWTYRMLGGNRTWES